MFSEFIIRSKRFSIYSVSEILYHFKGYHRHGSCPQVIIIQKLIDIQERKVVTYAVEGLIVVNIMNEIGSKKDKYHSNRYSRSNSNNSDSS